MLCEGNSINFFLTSAADKNVINFIVEKSDCYSSDLFADSLSAAIDFITIEKKLLHYIRYLKSVSSSKESFLVFHL
jgi:hypothetical protein